MQIKDVDMISEEQKELQKRIGEVAQERDENVAEVHRLCKLLEKKEEEVQRNRNHCVTLKQLVDRLEVGYEIQADDKNILLLVFSVIC